MRRLRDFARRSSTLRESDAAGRSLAVAGAIAAAWRSRAGRGLALALTLLLSLLAAPADASPILAASRAARALAGAPAGETPPSTPAPASTPTPSSSAASASPGAAAEGATALPASRCDGAWTVDRLSLDQRRLLYGACMGGVVDSARLLALTRSLLGADVWHAGALAWLVSPRTPVRIAAAADAKAPAIDALQRQLDQRLRRFAGEGLCPQVRAGKAMAELIAAADEDREPDDLPFDADFLDCIGVGAAAAEGTRLITIRADGLESLVVAFATRGHAVVRRYGREEMVTIDRHRFVVIAAPEGAPLVLVGEGPSQETPLLWRSLVGRNEAVWMTPVRHACIDLDVKLAAGDRLFVDGRELAATEAGGRIVEHALSVARDLPRAAIPDHQLAVLRCPEGGACDIRYLSRIAATVERPDPRGACHVFRLDLRERTHQQVAILGVTRGESCGRSPLRVNTLRDRVRFLLSADPRHAQREVADVAVYAQVASALSTLSSEIQQAAGSTVGPDTGVATHDALGTVAKEAWRQGLDVLMNLELQCQPQGPEEGDDWSYAIQATMIQVDEIFSRGYYGEEGLNLESFVRNEAVTFDRAELQESALAVILDRLFEVPASRFFHEREEVAYREPLALGVGTTFVDEASVAETITVVYKRIPRSRRDAAADATAEEWRPAICDHLSRSGRSDPKTLAEAAALLKALPGKTRRLALSRSRRGVDRSVSRRGAIHRRELRVREPGWYLVAREDGDTLSDAFCVEAQSPRQELWGEITVAGGPMVTTATDVDVVMTRARVGFLRYIIPMVGVGFRGGYGFTESYLADGQISWQDLHATSGGLLWRRHALLAGPLVELRSRWTRLPFELRGRLSPFLDVGLVSARRIPTALLEFRTTTRNSILDVDVGIDVDLAISYEVGPITLQNGVFFSAVALDDDVLRTGATVKESFAGVFGFLIAIGGGPR